MKIIMTGLLIIFMSGCASVGGVWEAGKTIVTGTVDAVVTGTSQIATAIAEDVSDTVAFVGDTTAGVIADTAEMIDEQTDDQTQKPEGK
jgi:hypothetical protein